MTIKVLAALVAISIAGRMVSMPASQAKAENAGHAATCAQCHKAMNSLVDMLERGVQVLAVHHRGPSPYEEIVLWEADIANPGVIDADEIAVISHSDLLRTIRVYRLADDRIGVPDLARRGGLDPGLPEIKDAVLARRIFCEQWRAAPRVAARALQSGISDMRVEVIAQSSPSTAEGAAQLRLRLKWASDPADGEHEASALAAVVMRPRLRNQNQQE